MPAECKTCPICQSKLEPSVLGPSASEADAQYRCVPCGYVNAFWKYCVDLKGEEIVRQFFYLDAINAQITVDKDGTRWWHYSKAGWAGNLPNEHLWISTQTLPEVIQRLQMIITFQ
jgi:hypothetical protein